MSALLAFGFLGVSFTVSLDRAKAVLQEELLPASGTPYNHASTLAETLDGTLVAAWFGGTEEGLDDVSIWMTRHSGSGWSAAVKVDEGRREDGQDYACWNPVLHAARDGTLHLYYKISSRPASVTDAGWLNWWGCVKTSKDDGLTWSPRTWLPKHDAAVLRNYGSVMTGPVKNKPLELPDGTLLFGSSTEGDTDRVHLERGAELIGPLKGPEAIQPAFLVHPSDFRSLRMICRQITGEHPLTATSSDLGRTWSALTPLAGIKTWKGLDAVTLSNGWHLMAYNAPPNRYPLALARSRDGVAWEPVLLELSRSDTLRMDYPAILQARDGRVHVTHSWGRKQIKHLVLDGNYLTGARPSSLRPARPQGTLASGRRRFDAAGRSGWVGRERALAGIPR